MSPPINRSLVTLPRLLSGYPAAAAVLVACFLLAAASVREKSNTFDEIAHVTAGLSYWTENDYRLHPENGNLPQPGSRCRCCAWGSNSPRTRPPGIPLTSGSWGTNCSFSWETTWRCFYGGHGA